MKNWEKKLQKSMREHGEELCDVVAIFPPVKDCFSEDSQEIPLFFAWTEKYVYSVVEVGLDLSYVDAICAFPRFPIEGAAPPWSLEDVSTEFMAKYEELMEKLEELELQKREGVKYRGLG